MRKFAYPLSLTVTTALLLAILTYKNVSGQARQPSETNTLKLGIVSEINQKPIEEHFRGFADYVARKLSGSAPPRGAVVVAPNLADLAKLLQQQKVDYYFESPYPTYLINQVQGAGKLLLRRWKSGMAEYRSLIFSRSDGAIARLQDLRGKIIAFEDAESTSGYFLAKFFLQRNGFKLVDRSSASVAMGPSDIGYIFAKSQDNLIALVLAGQVAAGAFSDDDHALLDAKRKSALTILAQTELLPRHLVSVRRDLAPQLIERLGLVLLSMHQDEESRTVLRNTDHTTQFDPLPGGEEAMRRRLLETFYAPDRR